MSYVLQAKAKVNVGFWGGITPDNAHNDDVLWGMLKAGALGFKSFLGTYLTSHLLVIS